MSKTYEQAGVKVRTLLNDANTGTQLVTDLRLYDMMNRKVVEVGDSLCLHPSWLSNAIVLTTSDSVYSLTSAREYGEVRDLRYSSSALGLPGDLKKVTPERMQELRNVTTLPVCRPSYFSLEPLPDQTVRVMFDSVPAAAENVDALISLFPEEWTEEDATKVIPYSKRAVEAVILLTAAGCGHPLPDDVLNALRLNRNAFGAWERDAKKLLLDEWIAVSSVRLAHGPTHLGWVLEWRR